MMPTPIHACPFPTPNDPSDRELLEERLAFGDSKLKVARLLLTTLDEQNEVGSLTTAERNLMYYAINSVLAADSRMV